ncbi:protein LURP-one-related 7 [Vitis riparia]|uniref:protein LURP-one-related 7 n=1 Tax=Vitis riparia TaxID=96939 RepID=UPI00155ADED4|nr:protein LURP-one-related 7 [Vitis riparia]
MASSALAYPSDFQIPFDLFISKKHPGLPRGYLGLADSSGNIVYRVNRRSPKHNRVLLDAAGNPLISMRGSHDGSWQCFRGDGSGEDLIFRVERTLNTLTRTEFNIFLGGANCEDSTDFKMKGCPFQRSCTIYKGNSIVAQTSLMYKLGKAFVGRCKFRLTIFPGSGDHAVVVALIVIFFDGRRLSN